MFSYKKMLLKGVKFVVVVALPMLLDKFVVSYPEWAQVTVSGGLYMLLNWLKVSVGLKLP